MTTLADYVHVAIYSNSCRFANVERFVGVVSANLDLEREVDERQAITAFTELSDRLAPVAAIKDEDDAQAALVARDLARLAATRFGEHDVLDLGSTQEERLVVCGEAVSRRLAALDLDVGTSPLRIVDQFPPPFDAFEWSAFAPDREDEERYGIPRGVYFRRDRLRPLYSEALFAHELIHVLTGRVDPEVYAMGLEEGIAEVVGTCYAGLGVLPAEQLRRILIYGRHGRERPTLWSVYLDHTRQAYLLFNHFGLDGLAELIRRGRAAIQDAEARVLDGTYRGLDLPRGNLHSETRAILDLVVSGYLPTHVFPPLQCLLLRNVRAGATLTEVCDLAGVDPDVGLPALDGLGTESALFVRDGDMIGYSNVERYLAAEAASDLAIVRYLPTAP